MDIIGIANRVQSMLFAPRLDDDFSDRLNYRYTVGLLVLFSVIIITRQSSSDGNIKCWSPAHFTKTYDEYVSRICWVSNTYHVDENEHIPKEEVERRQSQIKYYQWVIFILAFQAVMFFLPRIFWKSTSARCGMDLSDLIEAANNYKTSVDAEQRERYMNYVIGNIHQFVDDPRRYDRERKAHPVKKCFSAIFPCSGRYLGNYLVVLYFVVKIMFLVNAFVQIGVLSGLLGYNFLMFGVDFIRMLFGGKGWTIESKFFPKSTFCDFTIREMGNPLKNHRYTVQCVLSINLFNQQIFIIIWFWYLLVIVANLVEFVKWLSRIAPHKSAHWIKRRIRLKHPEFSVNSQRLQHFINVYLEFDGIFMLRLIANNSSDFVASDLIERLWKKHDKHYGNEFKDEPLDQNGKSNSGGGDDSDSLIMKKQRGSENEHV